MHTMLIQGIPLAQQQRSIVGSGQHPTCQLDAVLKCMLCVLCGWLVAIAMWWNNTSRWLMLPCLAFFYISVA